MKRDRGLKERASCKMTRGRFDFDDLPFAPNRCGSLVALPALIEGAGVGASTMLSEAIRKGDKVDTRPHTVRVLLFTLLVTFVHVPLA